jgi:Zn-finger nucleic acid-binding protein
MICPTCKKHLDQAIVSGVEVDYCPKCLGLWFEEEELRIAKDYKDRDLRWLDIDLWRDGEKFKISPGQKLCPADRLPLYETRYGDSDIKVDVCNICKGIWLDRGEFKKTIAYLKERADKEVLGHYLKNLREQAWEVFSGPETLREEIDDFLTIVKLFTYKFTTQHQIITRIIANLPR